MTMFICKIIGNKWKQVSAHGTVLNVFDSTVNIRTDEDELLVLSLGKITSPLTANIGTADSEVHLLSDLISAGDRVEFTRSDQIEKIALGRTVVVVDRPLYFENRIQRFSEHAILRFLDQYEYLWDSLGEYAKERKGCLLNPDMTTKGLLPEFLAAASDTAGGFASDETACRLYNALLGMCGRGPGFTPAGDDFISGFLATFNYIRKSLNIGAAIIPDREFSELTTWTSFKLMECNARGIVDMEVETLINSAACADIISYVNTIGALSQRGHTSGLDLSTGATLALCMVANSLKSHMRPRKLVPRALD
jgi:hypothetical protein